MSIGLYDMDMVTYTLVPFNLELMKLSTFYKKKNQIVVLAPSFTPELNQKFFVRKDYDDGKFPPGLSKYKNVEYGGYAFSNNIYHPLPIEIESCRPDTSIYLKMEKAFLANGDSPKKRIFQTQINAEHGRISLDGKTIWGDYMKQFKYLPSARDLILHDYDLGSIEGGFEEVKRILSKARTDGWATKIGMKFPVQVSSGKELLNWSSLNPNRIFYSIRYNGIVDDESWFEYVTRCRQRAIYFNLEYWVTNGDLTEAEFCSKGLRQVLRQVILSRSRRIHFSLKFKDDFFFDSMWEKVIKLFQFYLSSLTGQKASIYFKALPTDTVFDFAKKVSETPYKTYGPEAMNRQEVREVFNFIREKNYPLFRDLYECNLKSLEEENNAWN